MPDGEFEQCVFCGYGFNKPVSLHPTQEECEQFKQLELEANDIALD
jgi:hypothetical protein